jgi:hypothetical protein
MESDNNKRAKEAGLRERRLIAGSVHIGATARANSAAQNDFSASADPDRQTPLSNCDFPINCSGFPPCISFVQSAQSDSQRAQVTIVRSNPEPAVTPVRLSLFLIAAFCRRDQSLSHWKETRFLERAMGIKPTCETWKPLNVMACPGFLYRLATRIRKLIALRFASSTHLCYYESRMRALIFTGGLQEVLPGRLAVRVALGTRCAVCESCKGLICKVLR